MFWIVWNEFKEKIITICKNGDKRWYIKKIVKSYLFAKAPWKESATEWHSLKDKNRRFFNELSQTIGHCPSTLYAISKLLNGIGSSYIDDGIYWISNMLGNNRDLVTLELETNTIFYLENLIRKYTIKNREKVKKTKALKAKILIILNFLIERESVVGYKELPNRNF